MAKKKKKKKKLTKKQRGYFGAIMGEVFSSSPSELRQRLESEASDEDDDVPEGDWIDPDELLPDDGISNEDMGWCQHGSAPDEGCEEPGCD